MSLGAILNLGPDKIRISSAPASGSAITRNAANRSSTSGCSSNPESPVISTSSPFSSRASAKSRMACFERNKTAALVSPFILSESHKATLALSAASSWQTIAETVQSRSSPAVRLTGLTNESSCSSSLTKLAASTIAWPDLQLALSENCSATPKSLAKPLRFALLAPRQP